MVNTVCAVACCKREAYPGSGVPFHRIPGHPAIRKKWIEAIPGNITSSAVVCGAHFIPDDYVTATRKRLKFGAVPSVFPNCELWLKVVGSDGVVDLPLEEIENVQACSYHKAKYLRENTQSTSLSLNQSTTLSSNQSTTLSSSQSSNQSSNQSKVKITGVGNNTNNNKKTASIKYDTLNYNNDEAFDDNDDISSEHGDEHEGYKCNECRKRITGFRYTCVQCADWELCGACEARGLHAAHYALRVPSRKKYEEIKAVLDVIKKQLLVENVLQEDRLDDREAVYEVPLEPSSERAPFKTEDADSDSDYIVETLDEWDSEEESDEEYSPPKRHLSLDTDQSVPSKRAKLTPQSLKTRKNSKQNKPAETLSESKANGSRKSNSNESTIVNTAKRIRIRDAEELLKSPIVKTKATLDSTKSMQTAYVTLKPLRVAIQRIIGKSK